MNSQRKSKYFVDLILNLILFSLIISPAQAVAGDTTRVTVADDGIQGNRDSSYPSISSDGRYIAFGSAASNLVGGDNNISEDVFIHDRLTGETSRVSIKSDGKEAYGQSGSPSISADGRYVAFESSANLESPTLGYQDVFVHDRDTGETTRSSISSTGIPANSYSFLEAISADGQYVVGIATVCRIT